MAMDSATLNSVVIWARGLFMGIADVVPGFSGGTVALITGIYERLVLAISHFDTKSIQLVKNGRFQAAAEHVDFWFLLKLGVGIACGFVVTLLTVHRLLDSESTRPYVLAVFLGLVLGSSWLVWRMIRSHRRFDGLEVVLVAAGFLVAMAICLVPPQFSTEPPLFYVFVCGLVAICAMILPGISGALILMLLGTYEYFTGIAKKLIHLEDVGQGLLVSAVFGVGCLTGLFLFSRLLRFLFQTLPGRTLSFLCGLMLGSVVRLWPFRQIEERSIDGAMLDIDRAVWPMEWGLAEVSVIAVVAISAVLILCLTSWADRSGPVQADA